MSSGEASQKMTPTSSKTPLAAAASSGGFRHAGLRGLGRVITPIKVHAHHPRLLRGLAAMEMAQQAVSSVDDALKELVNIRVAMRIGCPF